MNIIAFPLLFLVFFGSKTSRQALFTFAPLLLYVFLYDSNRVLRKFHVFEVHTEDIYQAEVRGSEHRSNPDERIRSYFLQNR